MRTDWDVIVVGSGLGGLSAGAYLAAQGRRVLVVEQHYVAGGNASVFRRKRMFEFDVGTHYLAQCEPGGNVRAILHGLGLEERVEFLELDPDGFDTIVFPGVCVRMPKGWERYRQRLLEAFPAQATGVAKCVDTLQAIAAQTRALRGTEGAPGGGMAELLEWGMRPVTALFDACGLGPEARAVLLAQSPSYATPPSRTPTAVAAGFLDGYLAGAYYPRGGGQVLPARFLQVLRANGGALRTRTRVSRIMVEEGKVAGIELAGGEQLRAPIVISNADLKRTVTELVGEEHFAAATVERVRRYRMALPFFVVYLGLDIDLRTRIPKTNFWGSDSVDLETTYQETFAGKLPEHPLVFISIGSVKDPDSPWIAPKGYTSMNVMALVPPDPGLWEVGEGPAHGERYHRNPAYRSLKDHFAERLVAVADRMIPGIRDHIVWQEASTPITHERFTLSTGGTSYGIEIGLDQIGPNRPSTVTEIPGLYLAGANTQSGHGISGVIRSGIDCASAITGEELFRKVSAGAVFSKPELLEPDPIDWDPWKMSR
jgi:phytoene dehydrogenase-like protein